jgi:hypothetical protein
LSGSQIKATGFAGGYLLEKRVQPKMETGSWIDGASTGIPAICRLTGHPLRRTLSRCGVL